MPAQKPFTVDLKVELLEFLLELAEDWENGDDPDIRNFWHSVQREFKAAKGTTWQGKNFEIRMENEEEAWLEECENPDTKRRRGHEEGSQYDNLMQKFTKKWNDLLKPHWQFMVDSGFEELELVPDWVRPFVKAPKKPIKAPGPAHAVTNTSASAISSQTLSTTKVTQAITVDGKPLREIVNVAIEKALSTGNNGVAEDVRAVYNESMKNPSLMQLLKDLLTLPPCKERNRQFSGYVKDLKKRKAQEDRAREHARQQAQAGRPKHATQAATHMAIPHVQPNWASRPGARPSNFVPSLMIETQTRLPVQSSTPLRNEIASQASLPAAEKSTANPARKTPTKVSPVSKSKSSSSAKASAKSKAKPRSSEEYVHTSPPADVYNQQRYRILGDLLYAPVVHQILRKAPCRSNAELEILKKILTEDPKTTTDLVALAKRLEVELRQYDDVNSNSTVTGDETRTGASRDESSKVNLSKRQRESQSSSDAAEEEDLLEAERAAKRRKREGKDRDAEWNPARRPHKKARRNKRNGSNRSNEEESASGVSDEDIEMQKSAYVDEIVRRRKEEDARKDIEEQYGPVSPTDAGDGQEVADWASMASPTLTPAHLEDADDDDDNDAAVTCPNTRSQARIVTSIPPPPEPADASHQALQLISAAAADAVARDPGISRLEEKLDSLLKEVSLHSIPTLNTGGEGSKMERTATELAASCDQTPTSIASMLRDSNLESQNPELSVAILQLTQNATKSANLAARAAKQAAKMAQDVGVVLQLLSSKASEDQPVTPLSSRDEI